MEKSRISSELLRSLEDTTMGKGPKNRGGGDTMTAVAPVRTKTKAELLCESVSSQRKNCGSWCLGIDMIMARGADDVFLCLVLRAVVWTLSRRRTAA